MKFYSEDWYVYQKGNDDKLCAVAAPTILNMVVLDRQNRFDKEKVTRSVMKWTGKQFSGPWLHILKISHVFSWEAPSTSFPQNELSKEEMSCWFLPTSVLFVEFVVLQLL